MSLESSPQASDTAVHEALPLIQGLSHLHQAVALIDADGRIAWMSDSLATLCGGASDWQGRSWFTLLDRGDAERLERRMAEHGRLLNERVTLRGADGPAVAASISAALLGGHASGSGAAVVIARTEAGSQRVDREFRHTVEYLSAVLDSSPDGVIVVDQSRFITYANPAMTRITGYPQEDLVDRPLALFLRSQEDLERIAVALRPESPVHREDLDVRRRDGKTVGVAVSASVLYLPDGTEVGAVAHVRDETEKHRVEDDLAKKNAELEHTLDAVSHDLRSPLVSLLGFSRLLREDYGPDMDDKGRHFLRRIEEAGRTMERLIHDLLEISRIGRTTSAPQWADPREVLLELSAELKPRLDASGVKLELPADPPLVRCDRTRLYQVFSNLLGNALDHMGDVSDPQVQVEVSNGKAQAEIAVRDNGRGIDPAHHDRIFEVFQSLAPAPAGRTGTGVGLAIVKKIVETHGGRVWVESRPGQGACFRVSLPSH